jgi:lipoate-protein ligase A
MIAAGQRCRLLVDPPATGAWNMAVDEILLDWAAASGGLAWRFYRWQEPTLSLGYFQACEDRGKHPPSRSCPIVRRPSGGGAIVHDAEITYCVVLPARHPLAVNRLLLYRTVHESLVRVLTDWGIGASLCDSPTGLGLHSQPFLCFQRRSPGDVLVQQAKIAGSAQRRCRGAVLQHGSLLVRQSAAAPELPGIFEVARIALREDALREAWLEDLAQNLAMVPQDSPLTSGEIVLAKELARTKYGTSDWTERRRS